MTQSNPEIPRRLQEIDSASFQLLVNQYLRLSDSSIVGVSPNGSHAFKLKTTTGQPDAHFWLDDGRMMWAEHTTTAGKTETVKKFKGDINGCEEERNNLGLKPEDIRELKLCYTVDLNPDQELDLKDYGKKRGFEISFLGLATLATDLQQRYPGLAEVFLSVTIGTGQLFLLEQFIAFKAKHSGGIATPLTNSFIGRKDEVEELKANCSTHSIVCLSGGSGVGKSRLTLHALEQLSEENKRPVFVLEDNGQDVYKDLRLWFDNLTSGYLLVEDANRQLDNLKQVINFSKQHHDKDFRIVLTVRNYAKEAVEQVLAAVKTATMTIGVVSDEEIRLIVANSPYKIVKDYQQWDISRLAKGNIRFALMAARLLKDDKVEKLPASFLELFDLYFSTYVRDFEGLLTRDYIQTLGMFSLFKTFDMGAEKQSDQDALIHEFGVDPDKFQDCINVLRRRELVTQRFEMAVLSEQVFATYFFYLAFIKDKVLDFRKAMEYEFDRQHYSKLSEHVNEIGQRFGTGVILDAVKSDLLVKEKLLVSDTDWDQYFTVFWRFREDRLIRLMRLRVSRLPQIKEHNFAVALDNQTVNHYTRSTELRFLGSLLQSEEKIFKKAIDLAFQYCARKPSSFLGLLKIFKEGILLKSGGPIENIERQRYLFKLLLEGVAAGESLCQAVFLSVAGFYLSHGSSVQEYQHALREGGELNSGQQLRILIWEQLHFLYPTQSKSIIDTLKLLANGRYSRITGKVLSVDIHWIGKIISDYLDPEDIGDAAMVHELMDALEDYGPTRGQGLGMIGSIKARFNSPVLCTLKNIGWRHWNYHRGEDQSIEEHTVSHDDFLKREYLFPNREAGKSFCAELEEIVQADLLIGFEVERGLRTILRANLENDVTVGGCLLDEWLRLDLPIDRELVVHLGSKKELVELYLSALKALPETYRKRRFWFFAQSLAPELVTTEIRKKIVKTINDLPQKGQVNFHLLEQFAEHNDELLGWLSSIHQQVAEGKQFYYVGEEPMIDFLVSHDVELAKRSYLRQIAVDDHFDHTLKVLCKILSRAPGFLVNYVRADYVDANSNKHLGRKRHFGLIWSVPDILPFFSKCADLISEVQHFHFFGDSALKTLFNSVDADFKKTMKPYAFKYLVANIEDKMARRMILDGIRTQLPDYYPEAVYLYLSYDNSVESFRTIRWTPSGGMFAAGTNVSRWRKRNWEDVYELIDGYTGDNDISDIIEHVQAEIDQREIDALKEDKQMFGYGDF